MKDLVLFLVSILLLNCCQQSPRDPSESSEILETQTKKSCDNLPASFSSYQEVKTLLATGSFRYTDNANTSRSSWIRGASYYSCDNETGFLLILTDRGDYVHQAVPIGVWYSFKNAQSMGQFYNQNIKGRYYLKLNN